MVGGEKKRKEDRKRENIENTCTEGEREGGREIDR